MQSAGNPNSPKPIIFVLCNPHESFNDIYYYGVQFPASKLGYICERSSVSIITQEGFSRIRERIDQADIIIADISTYEPEFYLQIGYALGKGKRLLFIQSASARKQNSLINFEPTIYNDTRDLEEKLLRELKLFYLND